MKRIIIFLVVTLFMIPSVFASGDILTLTNNKRFEGKVKKIQNCNVVFKVNGEKYIVPATDIYSIEFENPKDKVYVEYMELQDDPDKCMKGRFDADNYHGKTVGHIALGVLFGPFAIIGAAVADPTPQKGNDTYIMSKNRDLFDDPAYLTCYKKKAKGKNVGNAAIGWGCWILFLLMI